MSTYEMANILKKTPTSNSITQTLKEKAKKLI